MAPAFQEIQVQAEQRWRSLTAGGKPWIRVGAALCGQAAGADAVVHALEESLKEKGTDALVSRVGCLGLCFAEPLVDVQLPGQPRVFYANVTPEQAEEIVESHVAQGIPVEPWVIGCLGGGEVTALMSICPTWTTTPCGPGSNVLPCATPAT
jgi:NADH-quinone oxidoreductase subunit F